MREVAHERNFDTIWFRCLPAIGVLLLCFFIRDRAADDHLVAWLPVRRGRSVDEFVRGESVVSDLASEGCEPLKVGRLQSFSGPNVATNPHSGLAPPLPPLSAFVAPVCRPLKHRMRQKACSQAGQLRASSHIQPASRPQPDTAPNSRNGRSVRRQRSAKRSLSPAIQEMYLLKMLRLAWLFS
jgi:hypothetical protein